MLGSVFNRHQQQNGSFTNERDTRTVLRKFGDGKEAVGFSEYLGTGPPTLEYGYLGDIYLDLTLHALSLYGHDGDKWIKWPGPENAAQFVAHPTYPNRWLWSNETAYGWISKSHIKFYPGKSQSEVLTMARANKAEGPRKRKYEGTKPENAPKRAHVVSSYNSEPSRLPSTSAERSLSMTVVPNPFPNSADFSSTNAFASSSTHSVPPNARTTTSINDIHLLQELNDLKASSEFTKQQLKFANQEIRQLKAENETLRRNIVVALSKVFNQAQLPIPNPGNVIESNSMLSEPIPSHPIPSSVNGSDIPSATYSNLRSSPWKNRFIETTTSPIHAGTSTIPTTVSESEAVDPQGPISNSSHQPTLDHTVAEIRLPPIQVSSVETMTVSAIDISNTPKPISTTSHSESTSAMLARDEESYRDNDVDDAQIIDAAMDLDPPSTSSNQRLRSLSPEPSTQQVVPIAEPVHISTEDSHSHIPSSIEVHMKDPIEEEEAEKAELEKEDEEADELESSQSDQNIIGDVHAFNAVVGLETFPGHNTSFYEPINTDADAPCRIVTRDRLPQEAEKTLDKVAVVTLGGDEPASDGARLGDPHDTISHSGDEAHRDAEEDAEIPTEKGLEQRGSSEPLFTEDEKGEAITSSEADISSPVADDNVEPNTVREDSTPKPLTEASQTDTSQLVHPSTIPSPMWMSKLHVPVLFASALGCLLCRFCLAYSPPVVVRFPLVPDLPRMQEHFDEEHADDCAILVDMSEQELQDTLEAGDLL